jgi:succinoglycan biosynthesis protein ExoV
MKSDMRLYYSNKNRSYVPFGNFGDELNQWLWNRVLPGVFDNPENNSDAVFVGFGTLLNENLPKFKQTIIFGTGHGFSKPPKIDDTWKIYCVRGPLTAKVLDLSPDLGIADPAILVNRFYRSEGSEELKKIHKVSLIPYAWEMESSPETFIQLCRKLDYFCIDPRWPVEKVMQGISQSDLVISAAMHGAIVADALRVPWIPLKSNAAIPDFKWTDFCQSLELDYRVNRMYRFSRISQVLPSFRGIEIELMAAFIRRLVQQSTPQLSREDVLNSRLDRLEEKIEEFKRDFEQGKFA